MKDSFGKRIWRVIYPCLVYYGVTFVVALAVMVFMMGRYMAANGLPGDVNEMTADLIEQVMSQSLLITLICDAVTIPFMLLFMHLDKKRSVKLGTYRAWERVSPVIFLACALFGIGLCITENNLLQISGIMEQYAEETEMLDSLIYQGSMWFQLLSVGIVAPVMEELLFRGVIQNRLYDYFRPVYAVILASVIFGVFHGNFIQFLYATLFALGLGYVYYKFKSIWAPVICHCAGNITSVLLTELLGDMEEGSSEYFVFIVIGAVAALAGFAFVYYMKSPVCLTAPSAGQSEAHSEM